MIFHRQRSFEFAIPLVKLKKEKNELSKGFVFECVYCLRYNLFKLSELITLTKDWCLSNMKNRLYIKPETFQSITETFVNSSYFNCEIHINSYLNFLKMNINIDTNISQQVLFF